MIVNNDSSRSNLITNFINIGKENSINPSNNVKYIQYKNSNTIVPIDNIFIHKYRDYLLSVSEEIILTDEEHRKYKYRPKLLSYDLYGSVEYWSMLMIINDIPTISDFNLKKIKYLPTSGLELIETILNKESSFLNKNLTNKTEIEII